ncbi:DNA methylase [Candidatus Saccharibacteria bacterium]|nr:DNA methylase [Candidatus Saccharibacteria bacterium]
MEKQKFYAAIDFKSFYASVECVDRGLDPMETNLVVADVTRTDGTICLAVSPSLKKLGLPGRCRLFEVKEKAREYKFETGKNLEYIVAPPRMKKYLEYSRKVYKEIFLNAVAEEDIFRYSIDEVFLDISSYLKYAEKGAEEFVRGILREIYEKTGLVATAGVGTNLYLAKVAMDILAKKVAADKFGTRIAFLGEEEFKRKLWTHRPLTDFWRIGPATTRKLEKFNLFTMGDLARVALKDEEFFYRLFGVDAELFIDHIWGIEPVEMKDIKAFRAENNSLSSGQVLGEAVDAKTGKLLAMEMVDELAMRLVEQGAKTTLLTLDLVFESKRKAHGSTRVFGKNGKATASAKILIQRMGDLFEKVIEKGQKVKRIYVGAEVFKEKEVEKGEQMRLEEKVEEEKDEKLTEAVIEIKKRYGANSISKAMSFEKGANGRKRNKMIGGHNA